MVRMVFLLETPPSLLSLLLKGEHASVANAVLETVLISLVVLKMSPDETCAYVVGKRTNIEERRYPLEFLESSFARKEVDDID